MFQCIFPPRHADAPLVTGLKAGKTPFRLRRYQVVAIENGKIQELARRLNANGVQTDIFRTGATVAVAEKSSHRITAATLQVGSKNIGRHGSN